MQYPSVDDPESRLAMILMQDATTGDLNLNVTGVPPGFRYAVYDCPGTSAQLVPSELVWILKSTGKPSPCVLGVTRSPVTL
jgi:hypothetical protein